MKNRLPFIFLGLIVLWTGVVLFMGIKRAPAVLTLKDTHVISEENIPMEVLISGIITMDMYPHLALKSDQAKRISPVLIPMMSHAGVFSRFEDVVSRGLSPEQKAFILINSGKPLDREIGFQLPPGSARIEDLMKLIEAQISPDDKTTAETGFPRDWKAPIPSLMNLCEGIYRLGRAGMLEPGQGNLFLPHMKNLLASWRNIENGKQDAAAKIKQELTEEQLGFILNSKPESNPDYFKDNLPAILEFVETRTAAVPLYDVLKEDER